MKVWEPGIRDQAAIGIVRLLARPAWANSDAAPRLRGTLRKLSADPNPIVRMQTAHGLLLITVEADSPPTIVGRLRVRILEEQAENVLAVQLQTLQRVMATAPAREVDQLMKELAGRPQGAFLRQDDADGQPTNADWRDRRTEVFELASAILTRLAVVDWRAVLDTPTLRLACPANPRCRSDPNADSPSTAIPDPPDGTGQEALFTLLTTAAHAIQAAWRSATIAPPTGGGHEPSAHARDAALIAHQIAQQLDLASGANDDRSRASRSPVARGADTVFADYALPLLCELSSIQHPQVTQPVVNALIHLGKARPAEALQAIADAYPKPAPT